MSDLLPIFSLAFTSVRPQVMPRVVELWNTRSKLKNHEWCIGVDDGNTACIEAATALASKWPNIKIVINKGAKTCVAGWNAAAAATQGKVIIAVADDFLPPVNWDQLLLSLQPPGWIEGEHVVKVEDGYVHNIFVLSILTRKRYERYGYVFYPKYLSLFCDTEFGEVALRDGVVIEANHLLFEHQHPDCFKRPRDASDMVHASKERWNAGEMLFNFRRSQGFPVDDGPLAEKYAESQQKQPTATKENYVAYLQVTKDDLCLLDICQRLVEEGVHDFCFCQPDKYWSGEAIEPEHGQEIAKVMEALKNSGQTVHHRVFNVDSFVMANDTRILVETRVRNESLTWIRSLGYRHILVVDGDELWMRGTLSVVQAYVEQGHSVVSVHMIPVIGVPGYPVEGALDLAVVYVGPDVTFKVCRSPYLRQTIVYKPLIYHFTGTRKGMQETIKKHRRSGHYDDPDYLFEEWIEKVLPNIKPGFTHQWPTGHVGLHFYAPRQIWPRLRDWRTDELKQMPETILGYLGQPESRSELA